MSENPKQTTLQPGMLLEAVPVTEIRVGDKTGLNVTRFGDPLSVIDGFGPASSDLVCLLIKDREHRYLAPDAPILRLVAITRASVPATVLRHILPGPLGELLALLTDDASITPRAGLMAAAAVLHHAADATGGVAGDHYPAALTVAAELLESEAKGRTR